MKLKLAILLLSVIQITNLFAEEFSKGKYYTTNGEKIEGLLSIQRTKLSAIYFRPCVLKFKNDYNSKPVKLENLTISSFVIGNDSFAVVQNFRVTYHMGFLKGIFWGKCHRDFAKVRQQGKINSFELSCEVFLGQYGYQDYSYFILSKDNQNFKTFDLKDDKEKLNLIEYLSNQDDLKDIIQKTNYKEINITELVGLYNKRY